MATQVHNVLRKRLEELVVVSDDFKHLERRLSHFCPFEAMGVVNAEIRHSNFLASFMDPFRPHGFGSRFLREVLDSIMAEVDEVPGISRLGLHLLDLDEADIRREWNHIDLLAVFPSARLVVAFELKIGATEGDAQLKGYRRTIEREWPTGGEKPWVHLLLFLTRNDQEPSDEKWHSITYERIINAIDCVLAEQGMGAPLARMMLAAYSAMLRKHHMEDAELTQIARVLWSKHREALEYLLEQRPSGPGSIILDAIDEIAAKASCKQLNLVPAASTKNYIRFSVKQWDSLRDYRAGAGWVRTGELMLVELRCQPTQINVVLVLGPGPQEARSRFCQAIGTPGRDNVQYKNLFSEGDRKKFKVQVLPEYPDGFPIEAVIVELRSFIKERLIDIDQKFKDHKLFNEPSEQIGVSLLGAQSE